MNSTFPTKLVHTGIIHMLVRPSAYATRNVQADKSIGVASQHCDGLRGPFVIYDKEDPYKYLYDVDDESTIITLSDWYHLPSPSYGSTPVPDSTLINGLGRYEGGPNSTLAIVKVEYGKRYRFRLISMSCNPSYTFSIDGHMFTIIEADGEYTEPLLVDSLEVLAGQRYSFILNATMPASHYWIRANPSVGTTGFRNGLNSAILRYVGAPGAGVPPELSINATSLKPMMEMDLHPLYNPRPPGEPSIDGADVDLTLTLGYDNKTEKFTVNGQSMAAPSVPVLLQILNGNTPPIDEVAAIYTLPANKTIQITFEADNVPGGPHPWHLHGHTFSVIRGVNASEYNFENPVRRDTVSTGGVGDRVTIRWRTDSSGPWLFHCHIDRHTDTGMGVIFIEDTEGIAQKNSVSNEWKNLCPPYEQLKDEDVGGVPTTTFTPTSSVASTTSSTASSSSSALVSASVSLSLDPLGLDDGIGLDLNANIDLAGIGLKRSRRRRRHHHGWNTF
ncbi:laccase 13 variant 1 [Stygiomarasmius scandens]|uniref:Laccase 13 variant 1 n=1 Tax=Marasmiellus scandens TaxID=2682957 RepID=A0ABR1JH35_9AGAR